MASVRQWGVGEPDPYAQSLPQVRAPEACQRCQGDGFVEERRTYSNNPDTLHVAFPCPDCTCGVCDQTKLDVSDGVCGDCFDEAEAHFARAVDRG